MIEAILVLVVLGIVGYFIIKSYNPALILIIGAIVLLGASVALGNPLYPEGEGTGLAFFDIFLKLKDTIISQVSSAGLVIMILFGYSGYMNLIGANQKAVNILVKPMTKIKSKALFIPIVFLLGNLMSLVVPSASSLAIILMAILYPLLQGIGISSMTAAGVIAMTATIMPTPLGADNVIAAQTLDYNILTYVLYHAKVSIPTLLILAVVHYFWQTYCDKKEGSEAFVEMKEVESAADEKVVPTFYAILPLLPLVLIIIVGIIGIFRENVTMDIFVLTMISFFVALIIEGFRKKSFKIAQESAVELFKGMGQGFSQVVMLVVGGSLFTTAIQSLGVIDSLMSAVENSQSAGVLPTLIFLARTISPVAAVVMIVSSSIGVSPVRLLKRTSVPTIIGIILVVVLSLLLLPY